MPSVERLSASSDFEEKLVTIWSVLEVDAGLGLFGTSKRFTSDPEGVSWSSMIGE